MLRRPRSEPSVTSYARALGIATATGPVRVPANPELGSLARVCVPVRCQGTLLGYLWLFDQPTALSDRELRQADEAARAAGEVLFRERLLDDLRRAAERELLRDVLNPADEIRRHAVGRLVADHGVAPDARVRAVAVVLDPGPGAASAVEIDLALQRARRRLAPVRAFSMATSGTGGVLLLAQPVLPERAALRAEADGVRAELAARLPSSAIWIGLGPERDSLRESVDTYRAALEATRVARLVPSLGPTAFADELGVYGLLARLPLDALGPDAIPAGLRRLLGDERSRVLVQTLEAYLDAGCDPTATAAALVIHRTTLYYRLGRIAEHTGLDLRDGNDRLSLHLGLKLARLLGL
ncbi:helix-turn-helix domain-containing protein [Frankia sp. CNm7]|uniref:Helix-turn-helix domain-containing protein n=2 Tax=Frankia nepalensis TaxID=1836974 RepID=A0A937UQJ1_9ACTN|nr:helix-turn-helix domain-containing protein [Frankia nepalensis]MBL7630287.1 helix-turn-helix domain-containing protein [Frankia nepalensis]